MWYIFHLQTSDISEYPPPPPKKFVKFSKWENKNKFELYMAWGLNDWVDSLGQSFWQFSAQSGQGAIQGTTFSTIKMT